MIREVVFPHSTAPYGPIVPYCTLCVEVPTLFSFSIFPLSKGLYYQPQYYPSLLSYTESSVLSGLTGCEPHQRQFQDTLHTPTAVTLLSTSP